jgi:hypothetical protein
MLTGTYDGTTIKSFIDGIMVNSTASYPGTLGQASRTVYIGRFGTSSTYAANGFIDDVRIYATALSTKDIRDLYEARAEIEQSGTLYAKDFLSNCEETVNLFPDITGQTSKFNISQYPGKQDNVGASYIYPTTIHGSYTISADMTYYIDDGATNISTGIVARYTDATTTYVRIYTNAIKDGVTRRIIATVNTNTGKTLERIYG